MYTVYFRNKNKISSFVSTKRSQSKNQFDKSAQNYRKITIYKLKLLKINSMNSYSTHNFNQGDNKDSFIENTYYTFRYCNMDPHK